VCSQRSEESKAVTPKSRRAKADSDIPNLKRDYGLAGQLDKPDQHQLRGTFDILTT